MTEHFHTETDQPVDYRGHLRDDHGIELAEDPRLGQRMSTAKGLVWLHQQQHPDHDVLVPSLKIVKREMTTEQAALLFLKLEIAATAAEES